MTRVSLRTALLLVVAFATTASAQTAQPGATAVRPISAGDRLRITLPDGRTVSAVAAGMTDTALQVKDGNTTRTMDLKSVSRVERQVPDSIGNGLILGILV